MNDVLAKLNHIYETSPHCLDLQESGYIKFANADNFLLAINTKKLTLYKKLGVHHTFSS